MRRTLNWIAALLAVACIAQGEYGAPVIAPAFEGGFGIWKRVHGSVTLDRNVARSGQSSLRIDDAGSVTVGPLEIAGQSWRLSFWMKTEDVERGPQPWHRAGAQVEMLGPDGKPVGKGHFDIGLTLGTTDWTRHERVIYFPPEDGVQSIRLTLMNWNCTGTTWFDDVELLTEPIPGVYLKVPPREQVENQPPRTWRMPEIMPRGELPTEVRRPGIDLPVHLVDISSSCTFGEPAEITVTEGVDIDRGYVMRFPAVGKPGPGPDSTRFEQYVEWFRGSPIHSHFTRYWLANGETAGEMVQQVRVGGQISRVRWFEGNRLVEGSQDSDIALGPETTKPFIILSNAADDAGIIIFYPHPFEVRRWYVEDYVVEREIPLRGRLSPDPRPDADFVLQYDFGDILAGEGGFCHSIDLTTFSMAYTGGFEKALEQFQLGRVSLTQDALPFSPKEPRGYWQPYMSDAVGARPARMNRYFPREFSSWMDSSGWDYGHEGGHGWGCTTASMKGIRLDPNADRALLRDYAWRLLTFFLEAAAPTGAPPNMYTWRGAAAHFGDVSEHYTTVFAQYWEWRMEEFRGWLNGSDLLTPEEKERVYQDLSRAKTLFDPAYAESTWTHITPNGGYWFRYNDKPRDLLRWVINTHTTSVGIAGDFALMARDMGKADDHEYWKRIFERGVDALIWAWEQPDMWTDFDPNEVRYARPPDGGPRGYHRYMVTAWTPKVVQLSMAMGDYRLAELVHYWKRMASAEYTKDIVFEDLPGAKEALEKLADGVE